MTRKKGSSHDAGEEGELKRHAGAAIGGCKVTVQSVKMNSNS